MRYIIASEAKRTDELLLMIAELKQQLGIVTDENGEQISNNPTDADARIAELEQAIRILLGGDTDE